MSVFPRFAPGEFAPLFRIFDDYATHQFGRHTSPCAPAFPTHSFRAFQPRFDVKESKDAYELAGELPGIDQENVEIEFTDPQTLSIRGRTERSRETGTHPSAVESQPEAVKLTESGAESPKYQQPSVEEDNDVVVVDAASEAGSASDATAATSETAPEQQTQPEAPKYKYYTRERSLGSFHRTFEFPGRVDQDNVKATLKNGILSVVVPKAPAPIARRINIE